MLTLLLGLWPKGNAMYPATLWSQQNAATTTGNSGDLAASACCELAVDLNVSAVSGSVQFVLERKGVDGVYYPVWTSASVTSPGIASTTVGSGLETAKSFGHTIRLRWTVSGSASFSGGIYGK